MRHVRSAILATAAATTMVLAPTAALADGSSHTDATGDVQSVVVDATGRVTDPTATPEPTAINGDIRSVRASNTSRKVKVVMRFADLSPEGSAQVHQVLIATPSKVRVAWVTAAVGKWGGKSSLTTKRFQKVRCSVRHHIDYAHNKVVVKVPASCLGHPKVIKVGAITVRIDGTKGFFDDAYTNLGGFSDAAGLSPKIHR